MNKKILIVLQTKNDIINNFKDNLICNSFNPFFYPNYTLQPYQPSFITKCINLIIHFVYPKFNYLNYRRKRHEKTYNITQHKFVNSLQNDFFEYTIVFRADLLSDDFLTLLKQKSKKIIAYQWDGMNRYQNIFNKIKFFDSFYCFDPNDENENVKFLPNFYFDNLKFNKINNPKYDFIYIGYFTKERFYLLEKLSKYLIKKNYNYNFSLKSFDSKDYELLENSEYITKLDTVYSYNNLLDLHNNSRIILDLKVDIHDGLSFRFFEAIQLGKKLITTNSSVVNYDFYHPNNIFILADENMNELIHFIELPYIRPSNEIIKKYSFSNWLSKLVE
ncbi:hypothetical protein [Empedobacter tilapiae]